MNQSTDEKAEGMAASKSKKKSMKGKTVGKDVDNQEKIKSKEFIETSSDESEEELSVKKEEIQCYTRSRPSSTMSNTSSKSDDVVSKMSNISSNSNDVASKMSGKQSNENISSFTETKDKENTKINETSPKLDGSESKSSKAQ